MTNQRDDHPETSILRSSHSDTDSGPVSKGGRREPGFGRFQGTTLEEYEEPERDTDYFSGYSADEEHHEEEHDDLFAHQEDEPSVAMSGGRVETNHDDETDRDSRTAVEDEPEDSAEWFDDEDDYEPDEEAEPTLPLRLIAVAVVALLLLAVGAYGVLQERAAMQDELRELRASLAIGVDESDLRKAREALRELQLSYDTLSAESAALALENSQLKESIAAMEAERATAGGTEAQAQVVETESPEEQNVVAAPAVEGPEQAPAPAATPSPAVAPPPETPPAIASSAPTASQGNWFVNFGSYTSRDTAQGWAAKLSPVQGEVVVVPGTKDDRTYYRVRVIGLSGENAAELVARQLEAEMQVSRLWVGQE